MTVGYPEDPLARSGRLLDAHLQLLDRQVLDVDKVPVMVVDDLELTDVDSPAALPEGAEPPQIAALLTGPVLGTRIFGGRPPASRLARVAWSDVFDVGIVVSLAVPGEILDVTWTERWVRDHIIGRIPGGRRDPE